MYFKTLFILILLSSINQLILTTDNGYVECPNHLDDLCKCSYNAVGSRIECPGADPREVITRLKNNYIHVLRIENCNIPKILPPLPSGRIRALELSHCNLEDVGFGAFTLLSTELKELSLANNQFKRFPNLGVLPKLISLNLSNNSISNLEANSFTGFKHIQSLRFRNNLLSNLSSHAFNDISKSINLLDLRGNKISNTSSLFTRNMTSLEYLDLSGNKLDNIKKDEFKGCKNLLEVRLINNKIRNISSTAFGTHNKIKKLFLQSNALTSKTITNLKGFDKLEYLDVSENKIEKIPEFYGFPTVLTIKMEKNAVTGIKKANFKGCPGLQSLYLDGNKINNVEKESFIGLNNLTVLGLGDNMLTQFPDTTLIGIKKLKKLNLRRNSITELSEKTFKDVQELNALDLSSNDLFKLPKKLFHKLKKLDYLDLSKNRITVIEPGSFETKVANILLTENPLHCEQSMEWFMHWISTFSIRTAPIKSQEAKCVFPEKYSGKGLKEVHFTKANETITRSIAQLNSPHAAVGAGMLGNLIPQGSAGLPMISQSMQSIPVLGALSRVLPGLKEKTAKENIFRSIIGSEEFVNPITRMAAGDAMPSDIESLVHSIPKMVVHSVEEGVATGKSNFNISSLPPNVLEHLLNGGTIPGVDKDVMTDLVKKNFNRILDAIRMLNNKTYSEEQAAAIIPPFKSLPSSIINRFIGGEQLSFIDEEGTDLIRNYYLNRLPIDFDEKLEEEDNNYLFKSPFAKKMYKLLPKGYNITKISKSVMETIVSGGVPNFTELPLDLQNHFKEHSSDLVRAFESQNKPIEELMSKLPNFDRSHLDRVKTYDISKLSANVVDHKEKMSWKEKVFYTTLILLGTITTMAVCYIAYLSIKIYRGSYPNRTKVEDNQRNRSIIPGVVFTPNHHSTPRGILNSARQRFSAERFERQ
uniref:LRRCT domain-containing protein n=1 Tax=Parastrongyloides trichosuri TaxID=131310 RepID=A0A0N4Z983_PARTI